MKNLQDKVAIVTGGTKGIGKAIALELARQGAKVVITYNSDYEGGKQAKKEIEKNGGKAILFKLSVESVEESKEIFKNIFSETGKIDILINNAGINKDRSLFMMNRKEWEEVISVNLDGVYNCCKAVIGYMVKQKSGRIVNITSVSGLKGVAGQVNYSAAKAGIIGFTKSLAHEVARYGVTVNAVAPGVIETDMTKNISNEIKKNYLSNIPLGRFGKSEEVANLVAFLSSDYSNYIIGQVIAIDGGLTS